MKKDGPLVSVIIPAFNEGRYIKEAIDSVIQQTYTAWEIIIVDDGSTDDTAFVVSRCIESDKRISYLYQENSGQGKARNEGLKKAQGSYVAFLDADDWWLPQKLSIQVDRLLNNDVDLIFSDTYIFENRALPEKKANVSTGIFRGENAVRSFLMDNHIPMLTVLATKKSIDEVHGFSENREITEDYHLWIRMLINGCSFFGIDAPLAHHRVHYLSSSAGEGKLVLLTLNCLHEIAIGWPHYKNEVNGSMMRHINDHLYHVNISNWDLAHRLLKVRNMINNRVSIPFWKFIYVVFGKQIFRKLIRMATSPSYNSFKSQ